MNDDFFFSAPQLKRDPLDSTHESTLRIKAPGFRIGAASRVAFSPSGRLLGQVGRQVCVYNVATRRVLVRSQWHYPHPAALAFSSSDDWFAVRSTTGAISVIDLASSQPRSRLPPPADVADDSPLLTGPTGDHVVEACASGQLRVRHVGDLRVEYAESHPDCMLGAIATTTGQRRWAVAFNRRQLDAPRQPPCRIELRGWPLSAGSRAELGNQFGHVYALAFAPSGDRLAVLERGAARTELTISLLSTTTGVVEQRVTSSVWATHRGFTWSPDGAWLVVGTNDGHALLDGQSLIVVAHLAGEYSSDAMFSPDGQLLALGYWGHGMVLPLPELRSWFLDYPVRSPERAV